MAVDTRDKRASAIGIDLNFVHVYPNPDGSLGNEPDRTHIGLKYRLSDNGGGGPTPGHTYQHQSVSMSRIGYKRSWRI